jgi:Family of unknown function (DUF6338)
MLPDAPLAFLALLALLPGWIFFRRAETRSERPDRSQLSELLELAAVGLATLVASTLVVALLSAETRLSWLFNIKGWARTRGPYLGDHLSAALASVALALVLSCVLALALSFLVHGRRSDGRNFSAGGSVWVGTLGTSPNRTRNTIGVLRHDGSTVEGIFFGCTAGNTDGPRDISLTAPIRVTPANGGAPYQPNINRILILESEIAAITVVHNPRPGAPIAVAAAAAIDATSPPEEITPADVTQTSSTRVEDSNWEESHGTSQATDWLEI